jgi:hypothetical protein
MNDTVAIIDTYTSFVRTTLFYIILIPLLHFYYGSIG